MARSTTCSPASAPARPHICFAGHTDVVPVGAAHWQTDPFGAEVRNGVLYGRGACDMKGGIAAFVAAAAQHLAAGRRDGSISLLITGDEEGPAVDGTVRVLEWMAANRPDPRLLHRRRADLPGEARRHGEDRPARQPEREDHRARHAGPRRLSASRRQSGAPPGARRRGADRRAARRRQRLVRAVQPAVHQPRRRQHGDQRDPRRRARDAEHPVQRATTPAPRCPPGCAPCWPSTPNASIWTSRSAANRS